MIILLEIIIFQSALVDEAFSHALELKSKSATAAEAVFPLRYIEREFAAYKRWLQVDLDTTAAASAAASGHI